MAYRILPSRVPVGKYGRLKHAIPGLRAAEQDVQANGAREPIRTPGRDELPLHNGYPH